MRIDDFAPFVRYIHYIEPTYMYDGRTKMGYDHRIFFCENGYMHITVDGEVYALEKNSLLYVPSGCPYVLGTPEDEGKLVGVNFDFGYGFSDLRVPIVPENSREKYDESRQLEGGGLLDGTHFERPFALHGQSELGSIIYHVFDEFTTARIYHSQSESALLKRLLILTVRRLTLGADKAPQKTVNVVISYIQEHYMEDLSNAAIGQALNFHPNYLNRLMIKNTGRSLHQYLIYFRLTKALDRLQSTNLTIAQIAEKCGFSDTGHFTKAFKKQFGVAPRDMRGQII